MSVSFDYILLQMYFHNVKVNQPPKGYIPTIYKTISELKQVVKSIINTNESAMCENVMQNFFILFYLNKSVCLINNLKYIMF